MLLRVNVPHHHRLQHVNKCTVAPPLFQKGSPHSLLLRLLHQQIQVADVLHGAVQLGAQVPTACVTRERRRRRTGSRDPGEECGETRGQCYIISEKMLDGVHGGG